MSSMDIIQKKLIQYVYSLWLIFGITGCILNLIIFSCPQSRVISCCTASVICTLNHSDPQIESLLFCTIRGYIFQITLMLSRWSIAFASIDRYASCSDKVNLRNFARTRWLIFYEIKENLSGILTKTGTAIYHRFYVIIGGGILPATIRIICALLIRGNLANKQKKTKTSFNNRISTKFTRSTSTSFIIYTNYLLCYIYNTPIILSNIYCDFKYYS